MVAPYHPGLPTTEAARQNYQQIYSDHLPFITQIPVGNREKPLTLLSWNVLESDGGNGFASAARDASTRRISGSYGENDEQRAARHERIAEALVLMTRNESPDVLLLQEIEADKGLFAIIQEKLEADYAAVIEDYTDFNDDGEQITSSRIAARGGNIAFYRKETVETGKLQKGKTSGSGGKDNLEEVITGFENTLKLKTGEEIRIRNVHSAFFSHTPLEHEKTIAAFLNEKTNDPS